MTLASVKVFRADVGVVRKTEDALRSAGRRGYEAFVLWSGRCTAETFEVLTSHVPTQRAYKLEDGLCVRVDGEELHRLNKWLYENGEMLGVQIHTHPTDAYHSATDSAYPIVTQLGALSLVVPDFAEEGLRGKQVAAYRLDTRGWREFRGRKKRKLLEFVSENGPS